MAVPSITMAIHGHMDVHHQALLDDKDKKNQRTRINETDFDKDARKEKRRERERVLRERETEEERELRRKRRRETDMHRGERLLNTPELEAKKERRRKSDAKRRMEMTADERDQFNQKRRTMHLKRKQNPQDRASMTHSRSGPPAIPRQPNPVVVPRDVAPIDFIPSAIIMPHHIARDHHQVVAIPQALSMMHSV